MNCNILLYRLIDKHKANRTVQSLKIGQNNFDNQIFVPYERIVRQLATNFFTAEKRGNEFSQRCFATKTQRHKVPLQKKQK